MNPIILYDNLLAAAPLTIDGGTAVGFDVANITDLREFTHWMAPFAGLFYIVVDCGADRRADCLAMKEHNLATAGGAVTVETSIDGEIWKPRTAPFRPKSDKTFMLPFLSHSARYWRLAIETTHAAPFFAVAMIGKRLTFPCPPDTPYVPYRERIEADVNRGKTGFMLGANIQFKMLELRPRFSNLERSWVEKEFLPFWDGHASDLKPFFYCWDHEYYPEHTFYVACRPDASYEGPVSILKYIDAIELDLQGVKE